MQVRMTIMVRRRARWGGRNRSKNKMWKTQGGITIRDVKQLTVKSLAVPMASDLTNQ